MNPIKFLSKLSHTHPEVLPLVAIVSTGFGFATYTAIHQLRSPGVVINHSSNHPH
ncbi:hypothetical protein BY458DRAFT_527590 [Sporodiniella umbellata]|nr:hypothetical protein BY458DRAFT_527590 [Sporodiniella umbellata]